LGINLNKFAHKFVPFKFQVEDSADFLYNSILMKIKITLIAVVVLVTASVSIYYANKTFFPKKFKQIVTGQAEKILHRQVAIGSIHFHPFSGFAIDELTIFEKDSEQIPFLQFKKVTFNILFLSIFKNKKIAIPSLTIEEPTLSISREENQNFNFSDLLTKDKTSEPSKGSLSVIIGKLTVTNGKVQFIDHATEPDFTRTIENIQLKANLSLLKNVHFFLEAQIPQKAASAMITARGDYQIPDQALNATVDLNNVPLMEYLPYYYNQPAVQIKDGLIKEARVTISSQGKRAEIKSDIIADKLAARFNPEIEFTGSPKVTVDVQYDAAATHPFEYSGSLEPNGATVTGLPYIKKAENISGKIYLETNKIHSDALSFFAFDTEIKLAGQILNFQDPFVDGQASGEIDLKIFKELFPDWVEKIKVDAQGQAQLAVSFKGKMKVPQEADISLKAMLKDVDLNSKEIPGPLTDMNGELNYKKDKISFKKLTATFWERTYTLDGELQNFARPNLGMTIHSDGLSLQTQAIAILGGLKINTLKGKFLNSSFNLAGKLRFPKNKIPALDVTGTLHLQLENLSQIAPPLTEKLREFNPAGMIHLKGSVAGVISDWQGWQCNLEAESTGISLTNLQLRDIALTYYDQNLKIKSLKGQYLDSSFDVTGEVQVPRSTPPILDVRGMINMELSNLLKLTPTLKNKLKSLNPAGRVNIDGTVKGPVDDWTNLKINATGQGPVISLSGYKLNDIAIVYNQSNRILHQCDILATIYDGKFQAKTSGKLTEGFPFFLSAALENTDLTKLKKDTTLKDKDISGLFSSSVQMEGNVKALDTIQGSGTLSIKDGNIWQLNLLQGLGVILFIPEFSKISFVGAQGTFIIHDQKITTENFELSSEEVGVLCRGWVDFTSKLNFDIAAYFGQKALEESSSIKKALTTILTQSNNYMTIKLTGTLKEPKYSVVPIPLDMLKKTGEFLKDGLQDIFQ